jgi:hypothetical protein
MYLTGSVIRIRGVPILIRDAEDMKPNKSFKILYSPLGSGKILLEHYPSKCIDLSPVPLGFMNLPGKYSMTVLRLPKRMWKVGLNRNNISMINPITKKWADATYYLHTIELAKTILGDFPSLEEAIRLVGKGDYTSCAFSRDFAVGYDGIIIHKHCGHVGNFGKKEPLKRNYQYLKETLELQTKGRVK